MGAWVWEGKVSGPAGVPIRLDKRIPSEHPEVSLPCLRPKAVLVQRINSGLRRGREGSRALPKSASRKVGLETDLGGGEDSTQAPESAILSPHLDPD